MKLFREYLRFNEALKRDLFYFLCSLRHLVPFVFRIMAFNYYICIYCFNFGHPFRWGQSDNFSVCHKRKSPLSLTFFWVLFFSLLFPLFILLFLLFSYFYHTALLAALFMRKVAQSTCKIKIIISSCWATAIICAPCAVHITQPGERGREKCKCSATLCVSFCVCVCCGIVVNATGCPIVVTKPN